MRTGLASGAFLLLLTLTAAAHAPQTRDPRTFRTDVEAVELDVRVVDESGKAVTGLTRDDFEVLEDGVRQQIRVFTPMDVPFLTRPRTAAEPPSDVQSNRQPFDGR